MIISLNPHFSILKWPNRILGRMWVHFIYKLMLTGKLHVFMLLIFMVKRRLQRVWRNHIDRTGSWVTFRLSIVTQCTHTFKGFLGNFSGHSQFTSTDNKVFSGLQDAVLSPFFFNVHTHLIDDFVAMVTPVEVIML